MYPLHYLSLNVPAYPRRLLSRPLRCHKQKFLLNRGREKISMFSHLNNTQRYGARHHALSIDASVTVGPWRVGFRGQSQWHSSKGRIQAL